MADERTLQQLAQEALDVQNACNLTGVVRSFTDSLCRLRNLLMEDKGSRFDYRYHPITILWMDKLNDLTGHKNSEDFRVAYNEVQKLASPESAEKSNEVSS